MLLSAHGTVIGKSEVSEVNEVTMAVSTASKGIKLPGGKPVSGKHYPSQHKYQNYEHWNDLRIAYDMIYNLQTQMVEMGKQLLTQREQLAAFKSGAADGGNGASVGSINGPQSRAGNGTGRSQSVSPAERSRMQALSVHSTFLGGILLKGVPPTNGQTIMYNSATGEAEWT